MTAERPTNEQPHLWPELVPPPRVFARPPAPPPVPAGPNAIIDWWRVIVDLERSGYSHASIAAAVGVARTTVIGWKNTGGEPRHSDGERLASLWCAVTRQAVDAVPRQLQTLSASAFR